LTADDLIHQFQFNQMTLLRILADVSQEESLRELQPDVNSINWIVGHLLATRAGMLAEMGAEPHWSKAQSLRYAPRPKGWTVAQAMDISELKQACVDSLQRIESALRVFESSFSQPSKRLPHLPQGGTMGDRIGTFVCHEEYHVGQIGLIRRLLGKPGLF
jgi:uncharacterized damage-inducible protein DinB